MAKINRQQFDILHEALSDALRKLEAAKADHIEERRSTVRKHLKSFVKAELEKFCVTRDKRRRQLVKKVNDVLGHS